MPCISDMPCISIQRTNRLHCFCCGDSEAYKNSWDAVLGKGMSCRREVGNWVDVSQKF